MLRDTDYAPWALEFVAALAQLSEIVAAVTIGVWHSMQWPMVAR